MRKGRRSSASSPVDDDVRLHADAADFACIGFPDRREALALEHAARRICQEACAWSDALEDAHQLFGVRLRPDELPRAVRRWRRLFEPDRHARTLALKRIAALRLMEVVPALRLRLIGHVLTGCAVESSAIELVHLSDDRGAVVNEKDAAATLLDADLEPVMLDADYPTAFGRRWRGRLLSIAVDLTGLIPRSARALVLPGEDIPGLTALIRLAPAETALPAPRPPEEGELPLEAKGALDQAGVAELLAQTMPKTA